MELFDQIIADAKRDAASRVEAARARAEYILAAAKKEEALLRREQAENAAREREEEQRSAQAARENAYRFVRLRVRRETADALFRDCVLALCELPRPLAERFWGGLLERYAEEGDEVVLGRARGLPDEEFVAAAAARLGRSLRVSAARGSFAGGMIVRGRDCDKNLTAEMLVREARERCESTVYEILFGRDTE